MWVNKNERNTESKKDALNIKKHEKEELKRKKKNRSMKKRKNY